MIEGITTGTETEALLPLEAPTESPASEPKKIRVVLVDDHPIVRDGLRKLLELEDDIIVVGEAENGRQALDVIEETHPDVLLLDLKMPGMDGITTLQTLQHMPPA